MATRVEAPVITIRPSRGWVSLRVREIWAYRELLYFLVWRDVKVRYKQTVLGAAWAIIQPLMTMVVFSVFFGRLAKMPSDGVPYPIFAFAALVPALGGLRPPHRALHNAALYWHFVDAVWVLIVAVLYVAPNVTG